MNDDVCSTLLGALGIAAFERRPDGAFVPLAPPPEWFGHLSRDMTFPFLGAFLDDARGFWQGTPAGRLSSGLCAEVDDHGREFHFEVSAVAAKGRQFLVFELAQDADQVRTMLQKAREQALDAEALARRHEELRATVGVLGEAGREAHDSAAAIIDLARRLGDTTLNAPQREILGELRGASERLLSHADALVETSQAFGKVPDRSR